MTKFLLAFVVGSVAFLSLGRTPAAAQANWYSGCNPGQYAILGTHVVQYNEWVYCIARAYQVDPNAIIAENCLGYGNFLRAGQVLRIPNAPAWWLGAGPTCQAQWGPAPGPSGCSCRYYHSVAPGNTLSTIANWYGVSMGAIAQCNGLTNWNYIKAGSALCIP